jgi:hypothetical protein
MRTVMPLKRLLANSPQIVSTDDYMPMAINTREEYEKVANVSWFTQELPIEELTLVVPSNMLPKARKADM